MAGFAIDLPEWFRSKRGDVQEGLRRYFVGTPRAAFTGRWFDRYATLSDADRFTPADLVAVEALSVAVPPEAAASLLLTDADAYANELSRIPRRVDLWTRATASSAPRVLPRTCTPR